MMLLENLLILVILNAVKNLYVDFLTMSLRGTKQSRTMQDHFSTCDCFVPRNNNLFYKLLVILYAVKNLLKAIVELCMSKKILRSSE